MLSTISCQVEEDVVSSKNQSEIKVKKIGKNRINNYSFALEKINKINILILILLLMVSQNGIFLLMIFILTQLNLKMKIYL